MIASTNQSIYSAHERHGQMAAQAESFARLCKAYADDAARHHNFVEAADLDVNAMIYNARARLHRLAVQASEQYAPAKPSRKEQ